MATFSQGIELVGLTRIDTWGGGSSYTVPAGHYARASYVTVGSDVQIFIDSEGFDQATVNLFSGILILPSGTTLGFVGSGGTFISKAYAGIEIFKNP